MLEIGVTISNPTEAGLFYHDQNCSKFFTDPNRALEQVLERLLANLISNFKIVQGLESLKRTHGKTALDYNNLPKFKFINF